MATIMCLPEEVIAIILGCNDLSAQDITNFKCMWEQLRSTAKYDIDWEIIFSK
ncbi:f-box only protein 21, partial [Lasius niger]